MLEVRIAPSDPAAAAVDIAESPAEIRLAAGRVGRELAPGPGAVAVEGLGGDRLAAFVEGLILGAYRFSLRSTPQQLPTVVDLCGATDEDAVQRGRRAAAATAWARDLGNTPASTKTPAWLAEQAARELSAVGVSVTEHDVPWLREQGFGGVLAVGGAAGAQPRFIEASWRPRGAATGPHLVLVGKGITFDTGGINLKRGESMRTMHTDMVGGAAVLAALRAVAEARVPIRVTALVPAAENVFGAASYRPGDIVRHFGGRTTEITNTDAEGRMVLADALAYAVARLKPTVLVDIATLTGAVKTALGLHTAAVFATSDELAGQLRAAGEATGEALWRMPLPDEYGSLLRSEVADAVNSPGNPGTITAALFLRHFTGGVPWAHLDIAGTGRAAEDDGMFSRGATGFGARLLSEWVAAQA
ncbi:MAG TPA: leucyl aminopeptidase family protein [Jatrophihabitans sp.]|nr:leucyl aminopeptidase family protein [Jatrophihabitans sp.]